MPSYHDYQEVAPARFNEAHMPVLILIDVSYSMVDHLKTVAKAVNQFKQEVCTDPKAGDLIDIAVVAFNDSTNIIQNWRPLSDMSQVSFSASGGTNLATALETGVKMLQERGHLYEHEGIEIKLPYLILLSDGYGGDVSGAAKVIEGRTSAKKLALWALGIPGYDKKTMATLTKGKRVLEINDTQEAFFEFFNFMAVSAKAVSLSAPGERIHVDHSIGTAESNCKVPNLDAWLND